MKIITGKLLELGFELKENYYGNRAYVFRTPREDKNRFIHDFVYYEEENQFYINSHKSGGVKTITEEEVTNDHNNLCTPAKNKWLEIKESIQEFNFNIYGGS